MSGPGVVPAFAGGSSWPNKRRSPCGMFDSTSLIQQQDAMSQIQQVMSSQQLGCVSVEIQRQW